MSESEMQAELERLRAENAQLKSKDKGGLTLKVSEKGGVSLYGMGRFPVTLYFRMILSHDPANQVPYPLLKNQNARPATPQEAGSS